MNMDKNSKISSPKSPAKSNFSMSYFLSPVKSPTQINQPSSSSDSKDRELTQAIQGIFNTKLIAAMISRDTILREVRDCILENDEERCKKLCKQIRGQWRNLSTHKRLHSSGQQTGDPTCPERTGDVRTARNPPRRLGYDRIRSKTMVAL